MTQRQALLTRGLLTLKWKNSRALTSFTDEPELCASSFSWISGAWSLVLLWLNRQIPAPKSIRKPSWRGRNYYDGKGMTNSVWMPMLFVLFELSVVLSFHMRCITKIELKWPVMFCALFCLQFCLWFLSHIPDQISLHDPALTAQTASHTLMFLLQTMSKVERVTSSHALLDLLNSVARNHINKPGSYRPAY